MYFALYAVCMCACVTCVLQKFRLLLSVATVTMTADSPLCIFWHVWGAYPRSCEFYGVCLWINWYLSYLGVGCKRASNNNKIVSTTKPIYTVHKLVWVSSIWCLFNVFFSFFFTRLSECMFLFIQFRFVQIQLHRLYFRNENVSSILTPILHSNKHRMCGAPRERPLNYSNFPSKWYTIGTCCFSISNFHLRLLWIHFKITRFYLVSFFLIADWLERKWCSLWYIISFYVRLSQ